MILRVTGEEVAEQAVNGDYLGKPYSKYDCQAFVEQVLKDLEVRKPDGTPYNWKGSNSMFRNHIRWRGTIEECQKKYGSIPIGAFMFLVKHDGGEVARGYHDDLGNASHVGLYIGTGFGNPNYPCADSQPTGGVQMRKLNVFTHVGLMDMIDYSTSSEPSSKPEETDAMKAMHTMRNESSTDRECLEALKTLTKYLKEVKL